MDARALLLASAGGAAAATTAGLGAALLCGARRDELATAARVAAAARALLLALLLPLWLWQLHADVAAVANDADPRASLCQRLWLPDERCAPSLGPLRPALALLATPLLTHLHHHPAFRVVVRTLLGSRSLTAPPRVKPLPGGTTRARAAETLHEKRADARR
jgi:hypothetical protein